VLPAALQDQSSQPYYREALDALPNTAVFSPLDLNSEQGKIEMPYKPVIRVSGKIIGPDGKPRALLVMNYLGDQLFHELKQQNGHSGQMMLLNGDGFWLIGPDTQSEWGFIFPQRKQTNLKE